MNLLVFAAGAAFALAVRRFVDYVAKREAVMGVIRW